MKRFLCYLSFSVLSTVFVPGQTEVEQIEFEISDAGDVFYVPLEVDGELESFLVASASSYTVLDTKFENRVIQTKKAANISMAFQNEKMWFHDASGLGIGKHSLLQQDELLVILMDLKNLRESTGRDIRGAIGMDVLRNYCLSLDFSKGKGRLTPKADQPIESPIKLDHANGSPAFTLDIFGKPHLFQMSTGSNFEISASTELFQRLVDENEISDLQGVSDVRPGNQSRKLRHGIVPNLEFAGHQLDAVQVSEGGKWSTIGLKLLARFDVVLDFGIQQMGLTPHDGLRTRPRGDDFFGVGRILFPNGVATLIDVKAGSPFSSAGFKSGDQLISIGGKKIGFAGMDYFQLFDFCLSHLNQPLAVTRKRGETIETVKVIFRAPDGSNAPNSNGS